MAQNRGESSWAPDGVNFVTDDLSPLDGKQPGEYMVRIAGQGVTAAGGSTGSGGGDGLPLTVPWQPGWSQLLDVYSDFILQPPTGAEPQQVTIPPASGRVYVAP